VNRSYWSQFPEKEKLLKEKVDFNAWLHGEGLELPVKMEYDTSLADVSYSLASSWDSARALPREELLKKFSQADIANFQTNQTIVFLETLVNKDSFEENQDAIKTMNEAYGFLGSKNPEIKVSNVFGRSLVAIRSRTPFSSILAPLVPPIFEGETLRSRGSCFRPHSRQNEVCSTNLQIDLPGRSRARQEDVPRIEAITSPHRSSYGCQGDLLIFASSFSTLRTDLCSLNERISVWSKRLSSHLVFNSVQQYIAVILSNAILSHHSLSLFRASSDVF